MSYNAMLTFLNMAEPMVVQLVVNAKCNCSVILDILRLFLAIYQRLRKMLAFLIFLSCSAVSMSLHLRGSL